MTTQHETGALSAAELYRIITDTPSQQDTDGLEWPDANVSLDEANQTLIWELHDYGNLTLTLSRSDNEWIAMTAITDVESVSNPTELNEVLLRQGLALPLASVGIVTIDERDFYVAYGQLFGDSKLASICAELHATASAAMEVAGLIQEHFS
ncbi:DUF2170 family protein [Vreelandella populi]|uniref:DUF2170 family protein n=1 Tax=Vreelandella populi TaxID=2498858 RepID=A0A3S0YZW8_9GAMM|nr:DUF2170 family protein [Halomonas populi]RUR35326.1 DUF2170 family protein [Halomonas populi]RUR47517.1 DUF2170 family protein [Halomonas populi]